ncbi:MAG: glycosyltransferase [Desulfobacterales bacterium]|jgi:glycosyltransferase involved in cell wall biosynthesis|nr:glycosyltransferase [Desulfobacterales bacterium]
MRIDFHVHSKSSKRPSQWILQKINCPESFTEPTSLYNTAKARGMTHVTITDHNSIEGALEIAHLPDTFISEEITTYFPEDNCKLHVLALNITEAQHNEIQRLRQNVFELVEYLNLERILNIVAHPLYAINGKLSIAHFEKMLLLFNYFEINGSRNKRENDCLSAILGNLKPENIDQLSEKHHLEPKLNRPWQKRLFGGSDDHSGLNIARTHTQIPGVETLDDLFSTVELHAFTVHSEPATPKTMSHNLYGIAYQYYRNKFNLQHRYAEKDILMRFLDRSLRGEGEASAGILSKLYYLWHYRKQKKETAPVSESLLDLLKYETRRMIQDNPDLLAPADALPGDGQKEELRWFNFVNDAANRVMVHFGDSLLDQLSGANVFNLFHTIGSAGGLYTLLAPYFVAYTLFSKDKALSDDIYQRFGTPADHAAVRGKTANVVHFTDTFYDVNGVAQTLQQQIKMAIKFGKNLTVITCESQKHPCGLGLRNFEPIGVYELPEYPDQKIYYPPFLEMLDYCYENQFTHIHSATPGPVGLAALAISKILRLPFIGTYHTAIPQYARILTGDNAIEELMWRLILWYYDQMDVVYAPSESTRKELVDKGLSDEKIKLYPRGIDINFFHPSKRNGHLNQHLEYPNILKLLYVGRISREKNLHLLANAFKALAERHLNLSLVIVGDGPYLEDMKASLNGYPCLFTGYMEGDALAELYASCDLFVFPSTTDTFGNVVLEAQASGLPVIVTDQGGPCENLLPNITGLIVAGDDEAALEEAIHSLITDLKRLTQMGRDARDYMEKRSFEAAFMQSWEMYDEGLCHSHSIAV